MQGLKSWLIGGVFWSVSQLSLGAVIAVVDSGLDYQHQDLDGQVWTNSLDAEFDQVDNDGNGFVDDVHGFNFIERNGNIIDYKYGRLYSADVQRFFEIQGKGIEGTATEEELAFVKTKVKNRKFMKNLATYANYAHGTHVAAISASLAKSNQVLAVKLIPTESPFASVEGQIKQAVDGGKDINWITKQILKVGLKLIAQSQGVLFGEIGKGVGQYQADIVNASFGIGPTQARMILTALLTLANKGEAPSEKLLNDMTRYFLKVLNQAQRQMVTNAPDTLFVFAAGNDGSNNDQYPTAPASIDHPNVISVAAAGRSGQLAPFSNYGNKVAVAAPGVAIESAVPDQRRLPLSGTSQAAPYVAGLAGELKAKNTLLKAPDLKAIILKTANGQAPGMERFTAHGLVNRERALLAAEFSITQSVDVAIAQAVAALPEQAPLPELELSVRSEVIGPLVQPSLF